MTDYKGGYQIVEIGTGVEGMYKKLESAYNSGKPILVKKGGKVSFGNVTKDGNYFVANYIIDDTLYQDTISQLDAITDSSIDIGGSAGDIQALEERVNVNGLNTPVQITPSVAFTVPNDGYIRLMLLDTDGTGKDSFSMTDKGGSGRTILEGSGNNKSQTLSLFVKKGMVVYYTKQTTSGSAAYFELV